ncbi:MAG: hypothetical protein R3Y64_10480 [Peptostreptococcaceae bacterium]
MINSIANLNNSNKFITVQFVTMNQYYFTFKSEDTTERINALVIDDVLLSDYALNNELKNCTQDLENPTTTNDFGVCDFIPYTKDIHTIELKRTEEDTFRLDIHFNNNPSLELPLYFEKSKFEDTYNMYVLSDDKKSKLYIINPFELQNCIVVNPL